MEQKIKSSGHVLVICTPNYAEKSNTRRGGVGYEQQIISGRIAAGIPRRKFIPIVRAGPLTSEKGGAIPTHFDGIYALDMRKGISAKSLESLLRTIFNRPRIPSPAHVKSIRLPDLETDGWYLRSGVLSHQLYPKTFYLPPEGARRSVRPGNYVKLNFEILERDGEVSGERMWVKVTGNEGPYFKGTLANAPISDQKSRNKLKFGSQVVFLPEHVIDIDPHP
jgi:hypothetical protein